MCIRLFFIYLIVVLIAYFLHLYTQSYQREKRIRSSVHVWYQQMLMLFVFKSHRNLIRRCRMFILSGHLNELLFLRISESFFYKKETLLKFPFQRVISDEIHSDSWYSYNTVFISKCFLQSTYICCHKYTAKTATYVR